MKPFRVLLKDFSGGLNLKYDDDLMAINEAREMQNCDPYSKGWLDRRKGCTKHTATAITSQVSMDNMIRFYPAVGTKILTVSTNNATANKLYSISDADGTATEITGGTALTANTRIRFAIYKGTLFLSNGVVPIQYWSGSGAKADISGTPTPPTGKYIAIHKHRLYVADGANLYYSGDGVFTSLPTCDFPADNTEPIGDVTVPITGIIPQQDHLVIFKDNTIHKWIGSADYEFRVLDTNRPYGCVAPDSIDMCEGWVVFLAADGLRAYDGGLHCVLLSDKITPIIDGINSAYGMHQTYKPLAYGKYSNGLYHLYYVGNNVTYKNREVVFNFRRWLESNSREYQWTFHNGRNINCACVFSGADDENELKIGDSQAAYIYNDEQGYSDYVYGCASGGNVIDFFWKTRKIDTSEEVGPGDIKKWRKLKVSTYLPGGSFEFGFNVDNSRLSDATISTTTSGTKWNQSNWNLYNWSSAAMRYISRGLSSNLVGRGISIIIREKTGKFQAKVHNVELYGKAKMYK